jgi:hypothetical protein
VNDIESARRPRPVRRIAAVAGVLAVLAVGYVLIRGGGPHTVTFEVASSGEKISSVTYGSGSAQLGKDVGAAAAAPWSKTAELTDTSGKLWLHVLSPAGGAITCTIWVDAKVVVESTTLSGAICEIPFDDALDH